jgi:hypothetical protein
MDIGPVELIVLTFPGRTTDARVVKALSDVVENGDVTVLDVVALSRLADGSLETIDVENLSDIGMAALRLDAHALIAEDDLAAVLEIVSDGIDVDTSALVIVYEETWARRFAGTVRDSGGEVALHLHVPRDTVEAAMADAESN